MNVRILGSGQVGQALGRSFLALGHQVTPGARDAEQAIRLAGRDRFRGKLVLGATNPLDFSGGMPPRLVGGVRDSGGERHQLRA